MNTVIMGAGAWGTAMAIHLQRVGHQVTLVTRTMEQALSLASTRVNERYLPDCHIHEDVQIGWQLKPVLMEAEVVVLAGPSAALREMCQALVAASDLNEGRLQAVISLSKGLEDDTWMRPGEVMASELDTIPTGVMSGPSFAWEVARSAPTALVLAGGSDNAAFQNLQHAFSSPELRVYASADQIGVELGGCLKNVYAVGAGICDGLKLGNNAKAAFVTRSLAEMVRIGTSLGGETATFYGLSGVGDLMATCYTGLSRNYSFGKAIGQHNSCSQALHKSSGVVEGYRAVHCFHEVCQKHAIETPILTQLHAVLYHEQDPQGAVSQLMARNLKAED